MDRNDNIPGFMPNKYSTEDNRYKIEIRENHPVDAPIMIVSIIYNFSEVPGVSSYSS